MGQEYAITIAEHFADLEDPRVDRTKLHKLLDIIIIAIFGVNEIPSHDTFSRVFAGLDPGQFQRCFLNWVQAVHQVTQGQVIARDSKTLRRSHDQALGKEAIQMVSAWASGNRLVLGQVKVDEESNEITALPELLKLLEIQGCIVTIDAIGCQTEIAELIVEKEADYVPALIRTRWGAAHR